MNKIIAIVGPTATGKSALAAELALMLGSEVISGDSMQIYRGMDIGTAKPSPAELIRVKHHLIDILEPSEKFTVADFVARARGIAAELHSQGRIPVVCGGTGLYIDSWLNGTSFEQYEHLPEVRDELERRADKDLVGLYEELCRVDAPYAAVLAPNDRRRIVRALEVYRLTGKPQSQHIAVSREGGSPYETLIIGLTCADRADLYARIDRRVDFMVEQGLEAEVRALIQRGLADTPTASQAIGYKEFARYIAGEISFAEAVELLKRATRRYAKRQLTWFRRNPNIIWLEVDRTSAEERLRSVKITMENLGYL